jgi:hypothetical protein
MNKENVVYMHNAVLLNQIKNKIMLVARKWMELDIIMLSKSSHSHKGMFSLIYGS